MGRTDCAPEGSPVKALELALKAAHLGPDEPYAHVSLAGSLEGFSYRLGDAAWQEVYRGMPLYLHPLTNSALMRTWLGRAAEAMPLVDRALALEPDMLVALLAAGV